MMFQEAAELAKAADVKEMWLTHYSPSLVNPKQYLPQTREIFKNTKPGKDLMSVELGFEENALKE
jgi:ribonuclease Z